MLKKNVRAIIISSLIILLPLLAGLILWQRLPEQLPMHWNAAGEIDGWGSRAAVVFGESLGLLAIHWLCIAVCFADPRNKGQSGKALGLVLWVCPALAVLVGAVTYLTALGLQPFSMDKIMLIFMGLLFIVIGNYLPKCRRNYTIGIKVPWALDNEENWNATHRFAGKLWVISGAVIVVLTFLPWAEAAFWVNIAIILIAAVASGLYSFFYYKKQQREGRW